MSNPGASANGTGSRALTRSTIGVWVIAVAAALAAGGCLQPKAVPPEKPVAVGVPQQVSDKVSQAQMELVDAVGGLALDYDEAVCRGAEQGMARASERQAMAEARLDVGRAVLEAKQQSAQRRGGGPTDEDSDIVIIEEPAQPDADRGDWQCMDAASRPSCVEATASTVAQRVFRRHIDGYDLNPVTAGDAMEAFAAEVAWGSEHLTGEADRGQALAQIEEECRRGESPLGRFFNAAENFDRPDVRHDLLRLRDDFVGSRRGVCSALPAFYNSLIGELDSELARRTRGGHCTAQRWDALWGE